MVMEANPREKASMYQNLKFHSEITDDECPFVPPNMQENSTLYYINYIKKKRSLFFGLQKKRKKMSLDDLYNP